jgi:hypothetical protein
MKKVFNLTNFTYLLLVLSAGATAFAIGSLLRDAIIHKYISGIIYTLCAALNAYCVTLHIKSLKLIKQSKQLELNYKKELQ